MSCLLNKSYRKCTKCKKLLPLSQYHANGKTPKGRKKYLKVTVNYEGPIQAPIIKDEIIGKLKIYPKTF